MPGQRNLRRVFYGARGGQLLNTRPGGQTHSCRDSNPPMGETSVAGHGRDASAAHHLNASPDMDGNIFQQSQLTTRNALRQIPGLNHPGFAGGSNVAQWRGL